MIQRPETRTRQRRGRRHRGHEDVSRKRPEFPWDRAKFQGRNERSSDRSPQTREEQKREADGDHAYGEYLGGRPAIQFLDDAHN